MKKPYSLDYSIEKDTDRVQAVTDILDKLTKVPSNTELEQMASYILYGKDEEGYNAVQRGEVTNGNTRYNNYRRKDDKVISLDAILDNPMADQQQLHPLQKRDNYTRKKPTIAKPKYDKSTGAMIDPGDSDIPGMVELWDTIERMEKQVAQNEGTLPPDEDTTLLDNGYRLYQLKHILIETRRHQYYLKDAYRPTLHFLSIDHPKAQFVDWTADSFYWITLDQWREKTSKALLHSISRDLKDYETRVNANGETEVKWVVREHTFDWENPIHVRALINNYDALYDQLYEKLDTYGRTLIFDFERYREMAHFTEVRNYLLDKKIERLPYSEILNLLQEKYGIKYNENHLSSIYAREIPEQIAITATKYRLMIETPQSEMKPCFTCKRLLPRDTLFYSRNRNRKDGLSSNCKECERLHRIATGGQATHDKRSKESTLYQV